MQQDKPNAQEMLGDQGNEGMYGQGQYTMDGKPDPRGAEAQQLKPDPTASGTPQKQEASQDNSQHQQPAPQQTSPKE